MARDNRTNTPVPERIGDLAEGQGLMVRCAWCTRGINFGRAELIEEWGKRGRIADVVGRLSCRNCRASGKRSPMSVSVIWVRQERRPDDWGGKSKHPIDRLVRDIAKMRPSGIVK